MGHHGRDLEIKEFDLREIQRNSTITIFGKHGTGKTSLLLWILYYIKDERSYNRRDELSYIKNTHKYRKDRRR